MTDKERIEEGDTFYSVMQKDNNPFEKPRIVKFVVEKIFNENATHPIVATRTDKWSSRHYCFNKNQIYLTYEDAIPEKMEKLKKIKQWEKDRAEMDKKFFNEQKKRDELEKNAKAVEALKKAKKILNNEELMVFENIDTIIDNLIREYGGKNE